MDYYRHHTLKYHVYFLLSDKQLKNAITFAYWDSLSTGGNTGEDCETAKMEETNEQEGDHGGSGEREDATGIGYYFTTSGILQECVLIHS